MQPIASPPPPVLKNNLMKIDGRKIAEQIFKELRIKVVKLQEKNIIPHLAIILVGQDPASKAYVNQKELKAENIGIAISIHQFPKSISTQAILDKINDLNNLSLAHGIIVQQPLPSQLNLATITQAIDPAKDVDGFCFKTHFQMPISMAVLKILEHIHASTSGVELQFEDWLKTKKIVVVGKGETGGKPIIQMFERMKIKPLIIDSKTKNPENLTKTSDIIISAVGKPNIIKPEMIKKGSILISIGLSKGIDGKLHGDYEEEKIKDIASAYTPSPGGVGPVNVAMLLKNVVTASQQ